jgi:histidinol-phosphate/aromatic aminotransferase/cobyric acid decarboxylase-like protein
LPAWLRVSIGLPHENQKFLEALTSIVQAGAK